MSPWRFTLSECLFYWIQFPHEWLLCWRKHRVCKRDIHKLQWALSKAMASCNYKWGKIDQLNTEEQFLRFVLGCQKWFGVRVELKGLGLIFGLSLTIMEAPTLQTKPWLFSSKTKPYPALQTEVHYFHITIIFTQSSIIWIIRLNQTKCKFLQNGFP